MRRKEISMDKYGYKPNEDDTVKTAAEKGKCPACGTPTEGNPPVCPKCGSKPFGERPDAEEKEGH
jgi:rubrerythrin